MVARPQGQGDRQERGRSGCLPPASDDPEVRPALIVNIEDRWDAKLKAVREIGSTSRADGVTLDDVIEDTEFCLSVVRAYREGGFRGRSGSTPSSPATQRTT